MANSLGPVNNLGNLEYYTVVNESDAQLGISLNMTSNLAMAKVSAITILGLGSLLLGLCPILIRRKNRGNSPIFQHITSVLMYFGGGVLLATTFLHLLPEVKEQIEELQKEGVLFSEKEFPFAECIMCAGFFMMFSIESLVHMVMNRAEVKTINIKTKNYRTCSDIQTDTEHIHDHHDHSHDHSHILRSASLRNFLIVMALSVHEVFEGMAVGLEQVTAQVWYLLLAVSCHKFVIALCLGLQITSNADSSSKLFVVNVVYVFLFAMASPLGIATGMVITAMTSAASSTTLLTVLSVVLQGIATGTLMYIVFFEILKPHHAAHSSRVHTLLNLVFLLLGFVLMGFLQFSLAS